ncbi:MAG: twin-arginine translocase TatA/TatE family subunit [Chloroflexota bacterium]
MNIFGIGGWELVLIVVIALVVAGPKRLAVWAYHLGQWTAKLQQLWRQFAETLQSEMDEAGVNVEIPRSPPTRQDLTRSMQQFGRQIVKTAEEPLDDVKADVEKIRAEIRQESNAISAGVNGVRADMVSTPKPKVAESSENEETPTVEDKPNWIPPAPQTASDDNTTKDDLGTWGGV